MMSGAIRLADLVMQAGGWPIDVKAASAILDRAEEILPGGKEYREPLTPEQLSALGFTTAGDFEPFRIP